MRDEDDVYINQQIARKTDRDIDPDMFDPAWRNRPDIYDIGNATVYEVKHEATANIAKARHDLDTVYVPNLVARWNLPFTKGLWHPGGTLPNGMPMFPSGQWYNVDWFYGFKIPGIRIQARLVEPGIIVWNGQWDDEVVLITVMAAELHAYWKVARQTAQVNAAAKVTADSSRMDSALTVSLMIAMLGF